MKCHIAPRTGHEAVRSMVNNELREPTTASMRGAVLGRAAWRRGGVAAASDLVSPSLDNIAGLG